MKTTQRRWRGTVHRTANPVQGVRITRATYGGALRRTEAGRVALLLSVSCDGVRIGDGCLVMTHDQATALYGELGCLLGSSGWSDDSERCLP